MEYVAGIDALDAWRAGANVLLSNRGECFNLVTEISNPTAVQAEWNLRYDPRSVVGNADNINDVIATVFPQKIWNTSASRPDLYRKYLAIHNRAKRLRRNRGTWGTYFERLVAFDPKQQVNQLERVIEKLNNWPTRNTTGLVFHLSAPHIDSPRTRGGPCWHFGEILWLRDNILDFAVVYRNHEFFNKTLGNYIALGKLLEFICDQTNKTPGKLICHSMHAFTDGGQANLRTLIGR